MDSYPGIRASFVNALEAHGVPVPPEERVREIPGPPMVETLRDIGLEGELLQKVFDTYLSDQENGRWKEATPFPGTRELLEKWSGEGIILSTATSKSEVSAERILREHDMLKYFAVLGAAQEDGTRRSKAAVIEYALEQLKEAPEVREFLAHMNAKEGLQGSRPDEDAADRRPHPRRGGCRAVRHPHGAGRLGLRFRGRARQGRLQREHSRGAGRAGAALG